MSRPRPGTVPARPRGRILQHVPHEGPGSSATAARRRRRAASARATRPGRAAARRRTPWPAWWSWAARWASTTATRPVARPRSGTCSASAVDAGLAGARRLPRGPAAGRRARGRGHHRAGGGGRARRGRAHRRRSAGPGARTRVQRASRERRSRACTGTGTRSPCPTGAVHLAATRAFPHQAFRVGTARLRAPVPRRGRRADWPPAGDRCCPTASPSTPATWPGSRPWAGGCCGGSWTSAASPRGSA